MKRIFHKEVNSDNTYLELKSERFNVKTNKVIKYNNFGKHSINLEAMDGRYLAEIFNTNIKYDCIYLMTVVVKYNQIKSFVIFCNDSEYDIKITYDINLPIYLMDKYFHESLCRELPLFEFLSSISNSDLGKELLSYLKEPLSDNGTNLFVGGKELKYSHKNYINIKYLKDSEFKQHLLSFNVKEVILHLKSHSNIYGYCGDISGVSEDDSHIITYFEYKTMEHNINYENYVNSQKINALMKTVYKLNTEMDKQIDILNNSVSKEVLNTELLKIYDLNDINNDNYLFLSSLKEELNYYWDKLEKDLKEPYTLNVIMDNIEEILKLDK